jgi:hypothetical protein
VINARRDGLRELVPDAALHDMSLHDVSMHDVQTCRVMAWNE